MKFVHFKKSEFSCPCGCGSKFTLSDELVTALEFVRLFYKKPIHISCGYRCKKYNDGLRGAVKNSAHRYGRAADVYIYGVKADDIVNLWKSFNLGYSYTNNDNMAGCAHVEVKKDLKIFK